MAGSLSHIVDKNGAFTMDCIENLGDAHDALEECFDVIAVLLTTGISNIDRDHDTEMWFTEVCQRAKAICPEVLPITGRRSEM